MFIRNLLFSFVLLLLYPIIHLHPILPISSNYPPVLSHLLSTDSSSRNRMPAPTNQQNARQRATNSTSTGTTSPIGEVNGRVDQLSLVQLAQQSGATPTMIAGFAMVIAQMQAQAAYPDVLLTITSSIGPLERSATFRDGAWHGYDLTHDLIDPRSHVIYGESTRPPMDQERSRRISLQTMQPPTMQPQTLAPPPQIEPTRFSCTLPTVPPSFLTPPIPLASEGVRLLTQLSTNFMLPPTFQGGVVQVSAAANHPITITNEEQTRDNRQARTVTFQDSYDELTPSSSRSETPRNEPSRLVGFQKDPKLKERQRQQQRVKSKTTNAPIDLRDKLNAGKRAREQGEQSSSGTNRGVPAPSPTQPEARRQKVTKEWLTAAEMRQLDITCVSNVKYRPRLTKRTP